MTEGDCIQSGLQVEAESYIWSKLILSFGIHAQEFFQQQIKQNFHKVANYPQVGRKT